MNNNQILETIENVNNLLIDCITAHKKVSKVKYVILDQVNYILDYTCKTYENLLKTDSLDATTIFYIKSLDKFVTDFFNLKKVSNSDIDYLKANIKKLKNTLNAK